MKKKIAVFTTGWSGEILSQFLIGMQNSLKKEQVDIFLFLCYPTYIDLPQIKQGELNIFSLPDISSFDGVVIFGSGLNFQDVIESLIERSKAADVPVIMQGNKHDDAYYIGSDNYVATREMCEHLHKVHDAQKFVFLAGTKNSLDSGLRLNALKDHLKEIDRSEDLIDVAYTDWENAVATDYINEFISSGRELPDVFMCANDGLAMETCRSLENNGIKVPDDVLVTGFDFIETSQIYDPSITSVDQCFTSMGITCGKLWLDITNGVERRRLNIIPCEFIPGESCGCYEKRNSDKLRRRMGKETFSKRAMTTYFNRKLNLIDSTVLSCLTYQEFKDKLHELLVRNHDYEGDSFHVLLEPNFGLSIYDRNIKLNKEGYSSYMEVLYSTEDGAVFEDVQFSSEHLVPGYTGEGENHMYVFLPIHEADEAYGYIVFRDCMDKVENHFLQTYQSRMGLVFDKFRHSLSLDILNKRLLELMRKDPLTNVNNRTAYEEKETYLQSEINIGSGIEFAIAMFDVNNLKLINDASGHDAGDSYLVRCCHLICDVFKHSPVYRIGGDEFVAVLTGDDYANQDALFENLKSRLSPYSIETPLPEDYISLACGVSAYDPESDRTVPDVVKRADEAMYKNKAEIKNSK